MCGIWAVFGSEDDVSLQCNAVHTIGHRGPDAFRIENIQHFQNCCLGFHRLSIVDDMRGMQPMRLYSHPQIWLIYNGEIYNHKLLDKDFDLNVVTDCDGEPIIHLYHKLGPQKMAAQLDGVFAFCILDTAKRRVILGRDTFGVRPLFRIYTGENGFLGVCSEAKGLINLSYPSPRDGAVNGIEPFPPGHVEVYQLDQQGRATRIDSETFCFNRPGQMPMYRTLASPDSNNTKENIRTLLEAAVDKRLMSERRVGCMLSGGLDSSLVAALLVKLSKQRELDYPIQSFAIGMQGSPDLIAARKVANYLGTEHKEVVFTAEEALAVIPDVIHKLESYDITTVRASVGMYLVSSFIKTQTDTTVVLSGEGSDELAQGYIYFHNAPDAAEADKESRRLLHDLYLYDVLRGDRTTAAHGLEIRVPFLDHQFTSYYLSLPAEDRLPKEGVEKHLLRSAFDDGQLLPSEILWRPKEAFSDGVSCAEKSWFQVVQEYCEEKINDQELEQAPARYPHNPPRTKEALFYRQVFEERFPGKAAWIPYFWMPRWVAADDPSARTLKHYKQ